MDDIITDMPELAMCPLLNISQCAVSSHFQESLTVNIYNQLTRLRAHTVRIPVTPGSYQVKKIFFAIIRFFVVKVKDNTGTEIESQLVPLPPSVLVTPGRDSSATHELVFNTMLSPLSLVTHYVTRMERRTEMHRESWVTRLGKHDRVTLGKNKLKISIKHGSTTIHVKDTERNIEDNVVLGLMYYPGHRGNNSEFEFRASGAYIFRPDSEAAVGFGPPNETLVTEGPIVDEVIFSYPEPWVTMTLRLYHLENIIELGWSVGPIPVDDGVGKEVITRSITLMIER